MALIEVRLRPTGPWRTGYRGDRERVDVVYHSDTLFSAVTHAMRALGWMEEWLAATAGGSGEPAVRLGSLFPFVGKTRLIAPPKSVWPPSGRGQLHLTGAKLVPLEVLRQGLQDESRWEVDGECQCLLPSNSTPPFRVVIRESAAVDRLTGLAEGHKTACLEFAANAGFWGVFSATDKLWEGRVKSALRLLADSGLGGERSRGWGRSSEPQFNDASHLFPVATDETAAWWLLSMYSPAPADAVDWTKSESSVTVRGGWTDSAAGVAQKQHVRLVEEGSVLSAPSLRGQAVDVAPEGFAHPVYRAGFALAVPVPSVAEPAPKTKPAKEAKAEAPAQAVPSRDREGADVPEPPIFDGAEVAQPIEEPNSMAEPEPGLPSQTTASRDAAPESEAAVETEALAESESVAESEAVAEPQAVVEPEAVAEPETVVAPEVVAEPETMAEPEAAAEPEAVAEPQAMAEPEPAGEGTATSEAPAPATVPDPAAPPAETTDEVQQ